MREGKAPVSLARLVHHATRADDVAAVLSYAPEAARQAQQRGAHREAAAHWRTALQHVSGVKDADEADRATWLDAYAGELPTDRSVERSHRRAFASGRSASTRNQHSGRGRESEPARLGLCAGLEEDRRRRRKPQGDRAARGAATGRTAGRRVPGGSPTAHARSRLRGFGCLGHQSHSTGRAVRAPRNSCRCHQHARDRHDVHRLRRRLCAVATRAGLGACRLLALHRGEHL